MGWLHFSRALFRDHITARLELHNDRLALSLPASLSGVGEEVREVGAVRLHAYMSNVMRVSGRLPAECEAEVIKSSRKA